LIKNVAQEKERTCTKKEKMSEKKEDRKKGEGREGVKFRKEQEQEQEHV